LGDGDGEVQHSLYEFIEELYGTPARQGFMFRLFDFESRGVEIAEILSFLLRHREGGPSAWSQPIAIPVAALGTQ